MAWSYGTYSCFSLQLALRVFVGDAGRHAHPTAAGALGPVGGLGHTLVLQVVPHWQVFVAVFVLPAVGLAVYQLVTQHQLIPRLVRDGVKSGLVFRWVRHLMFRWQAPDALMAVHTEAALSWHPDQPWVRARG